MKDVNIPLMLISILADGKFHSNKLLVKCLRINIAEVKKHIQTICNWGGEIFTIPGKGYRLLYPIQLLDENIINSQIIDGKVIVLPVINSTNQYLLDRIGVLNSGDICIAECQQAGRGRRGKKWFSPFGVNLYLSMFWRFNQKVHVTIIGLILAISITITEVLQDIGADDVRIKWPNDIYLENRKLAGILIESIVKAGDVAQIVIGIGINIMMRNVQAAVVNQSWVALLEICTLLELDRNALTVRLINKLHVSLALFEQEGLAPFLLRWKKLDNFINRQVKLVIGDKEVYGISRGINLHGALMLEQDGIIKPWVGEGISLRNIEQKRKKLQEIF